MSKQKSDESAGQKEQDVLAAIMGLKPKIPSLDEIFHTYLNASGTHDLLLEKPGGVVEYASPERLAMAITRWSILHAPPKMRLTSRQVVSVATQFQRYKEPLDPQAVAMVRFAGDDGLAFSKVDWRPERGSTPRFDDLMGRISPQPETLEAFIGSIFFEQADREQYALIYGDGGDGKGSLLDMLSATLGPGYHSAQAPDAGNKRFWAHSIRGKRLVGMTDFSKMSFLESDIFKAVTGGDIMACEGKNERQTNHRFNTKFMIMTNDEPDFARSRSNVRRVLYYQVEPGERDYRFKRELVAEAPHIVHRCIEAYRRLCPDHMPIPYAENEMMYANSTTDIVVDGLLNRFLAIDPNGVTPCFVVQEKIEELNFGRISRSEVSRIYKHFFQKYLIKKQTRRWGGEGQKYKCLVGVRLKEGTEKRAAIEDSMRINGAGRDRLRPA